MPVTLQAKEILGTESDPMEIAPPQHHNILLAWHMARGSGPLFLSMPSVASRPTFSWSSRDWECMAFPPFLQRNEQILAWKNILHVRFCVPEDDNIFLNLTLEVLAI
jgi:hypothetical protein